MRTRPEQQGVPASDAHGPPKPATLARLRFCFGSCSGVLARLPGRSLLVSLPTWAALGLSLLSGDARATQDAATARELFKQARRLMDSQQYPEACAKLEESRRLDDGIGTRFNLAYCWEQQGRLASAWSLYLNVAESARASRQVEREAIARRRAQSLEERLAHLQLEILEPVPGLLVVRDGLQVSALTWGASVPVDPGRHSVEVQAPNHQPWRHTVSIQPGETLRLSVPALKAAGGDERTLPAPELDLAEAHASAFGGGGGYAVDSGVSPLRVGGLVTGGVGALGVLAGGYFLWSFHDRNAKAESLCTLPDADGNPRRCQDEPERRKHDRLLREAKTNRTRGALASSIGGVLLATGAVLYFWDALWAEPNANAAKWRLVPGWASSQEASLWLQGTF